MRTVVVFDEILTVKTEPTPVIQDDEVLIRLYLGGICSTDLALMRGYKNFKGILGHEFVGEVIEGLPEWMGERVVGDINIACGKCEFCQRGIELHCENRFVLGITGDYDGTFADVFRFPIRNLHRVPDNIPDKAALFTEPLAAAAKILNQVDFRPDDTVVVLGVGRLGMLVAQVLKQANIHVIGIVRHQRQLDLLKKWDIEAKQRSELPNHCADVVVDCTGSADGFNDAITLLKSQGTLVLKSTYEGLSLVDLTTVAVNELKIVGSRCGDFEVALDLLKNEKIDVLSMIDGEYPLEQVTQAFEHAAQHGVLKILLHP